MSGDPAPNSATASPATRGWAQTEPQPRPQTVAAREHGERRVVPGVLHGAGYVVAQLPDIDRFGPVGEFNRAPDPRDVPSQVRRRLLVRQACQREMLFELDADLMLLPGIQSHDRPFRPERG